MTPPQGLHHVCIKSVESHQAAHPNDEESNEGKRYRLCVCAKEREVRLQNKIESMLLVRVERPVAAEDCFLSGVSCVRFATGCWAGKGQGQNNEKPIQQQPRTAAWFVSSFRYNILCAARGTMRYTARIEVLFSPSRTYKLAGSVSLLQHYRRTSLCARPRRHNRGDKCQRRDKCKELLKLASCSMAPTPPRYRSERTGLASEHNTIHGDVNSRPPRRPCLRVP